MLTHSAKPNQDGESSDNGQDNGSDGGDGGDNGADDSTLSAGAKAGISIGVLLGVGVLAAAFLVCRKKRRNQTGKEELEMSESTDVKDVDIA